MANNIRRMINEKGIVLEKFFKKATDAFTSSDGKAVPAQPERYILKCVSGEEFSKVDGYVNSTVLECKVDKATFDKAQFGSNVCVKYELSNFGVRADSVKLIDNK